MRVAMIVIASLGGIYDRMIEEYWIPFIKKTTEIDVFLIFGNNFVNKWPEIENNVISFDCPENLIPGVLIKTILMFERIMGQYDYILRTNLSSIIIVDRYLDWLNTLPSAGVYAGINAIHNGIHYISGAGFTISNDILEYIVYNKNKINVALIDDVTIGELLSPFNKINGKRIDFTDNKRYVSRPDIGDNYHIRVKNTNDRRIDLEIMNMFL